VAPRPRTPLSISVKPGVKVGAGLGLLALATAALLGWATAPSPWRWFFLLLLPLAGVAALRVARQRWWLEGTVIYKQQALRAKRIDLSHANVEPGYVAGGTRLTTFKAHDPIAKRRMRVPLVTAAGRPLPPQQIKALHDAIAAGQRWRQKRHSERAALVCAYLSATQ
jgi:MFS family permease